MHTTKARRPVPTRKFPQPKLLTYEDYARLTPLNSGNYELRNGKIEAMPSPIPSHQLISSELHIALGGFIRQHRLGKFIAAPMDTQFTEHDTFQPDLLFVSNERLGIIGEKKIEGAPDLVVEILSPGNTPKEMSYKRHVYESTGVREYWFIEPEQRTLSQYERVGDELRWQRTLTPDDILRSAVVAGFEMGLGRIFEG